MAQSHALGAARARLKELCDIVSEATGASFSPLHAKSYRALVDGIREGDVGVAWMPPLLAIELEEGNAATPLVLPLRHEGASYYSTFVMREARDAREGRASGHGRHERPERRERSIAEMRGKRVAWVDRESAAGYLVPRIHLASLGIDLRSFFGHETFAGSHIAAIDAVVSGAADVAATFCTIEPVTKRIMTAGWMAADGSKVREVERIATVGPIPNDAIVASTRVQASVRTGLTRWLLSPDTRSQELLAELFQVRAFRIASGAHFDALRHMVRAARARGFDA